METENETLVAHLERLETELKGEINHRTAIKDRLKNAEDVTTVCNGQIEKMGNEEGDSDEGQS